MRRKCKQNSSRLLLQVENILVSVRGSKELGQRDLDDHFRERRGGGKRELGREWVSVLRAREPSA